MNFKNKYSIATIFVIILIIIFSYFYFSSSSKIDNKIPESEQMTEQQKLDILSKMSEVSISKITEVEKEKILNQIDTNNKATSTVSQEQILQFLNKTN